MARYKFHQESYVGNVLIAAEQEYEVPPLGRKKSGEPLHHIPGPHWEPLDDEAKAICKMHDIKFTGEVPDAIGPLTDQLAETMAAQNKATASGGIDVEALGAAIAKGITAAQQPQRAARG
jgi:hypothetical protein